MGLSGYCTDPLQYLLGQYSQEYYDRRDLTMTAPLMVRDSVPARDSQSGSGGTLSHRGVSLVDDVPESPLVGTSSHQAHHDTIPPLCERDGCTCYATLPGTGCGMQVHAITASHAVVAWSSGVAPWTVTLSTLIPLTILLVVSVV